MNIEDLKFPPDFFWGAATAAHQIEGGNNNDWTDWEKSNAERLAKEAPGKWALVVPNWNRIKPEATDSENYISGLAADHYQKFHEDIKIIKELNLNAFRFSIEWSRIQPEENVWNELEIEHYRDVINELRSKSIEPFVTLWHRTNPKWVAAQGGWANKKTIADFGKFTERMAIEFGNPVKYWTPLNEPFLCATASYLGGEYPPQKKNPFLFFKCLSNFIAAHKLAYKIIQQRSLLAQVGTADAAIAVEGFKNRWINNLLAATIRYFADYKFEDAVKNSTDFFGVQYYQASFIKIAFSKYFLPTIKQIPASNIKSDMGWSIYAPGLYDFVMHNHRRYNKPIFITENGIPDALDIHRSKFIVDHLTQLHRAIKNGAQVRGYLHWSLLDNLEWNKGFWPKFGLVAVDRQNNFHRSIRQSALTYAKIARENELKP